MTTEQMMTNGVDWEYFNQYEKLTDNYLPARGEGENMATQAVTAMAKLVFKWYNDGDVFDNTYFLGGWANDLSSYANWLFNNTRISSSLEKIYEATFESEYEQILKECADKLFDENYLKELAKSEKAGSIYKCDGPFKYEEDEEDGNEFSW